MGLSPHIGGDRCEVAPRRLTHRAGHEPHEAVVERTGVDDLLQRRQHRRRRDRPRRWLLGEQGGDEIGEGRFDGGTAHSDIVEAGHAAVAHLLHDVSVGGGVEQATVGEGLPQDDAEGEEVC